MSVSPSVTTHRTTPGRTGRPTADDLESRHPLGRWLHRQERRLLDAVHALGMFDSCHEIERLHDAERDRVLLEAIRLGDAGRPWIEVRAHLLEAVRIDALADACDANGVGHVRGGARRAIREIGGGLERLAVALRGKS